MRHAMVVSAAALILGSGVAGPAAADTAGPQEPSATCSPVNAPCFHLESAIAFGTTRDDPTGNPLLTAEIYLVDPDGTDPRRLTNNGAGDGFPVLSPDGKTVVFDSNRDRGATEPLNTSDLFVMTSDGSEQQRLARGSSATWSPDGRDVAYHASSSGTGTPIRTDPGSATTDSDIFVTNVDDALAGVALPRNVTNTPTMIEDDPDWSPTGTMLVFTSHPATDHPVLSNAAEIYVLVPTDDGGAVTQRLTFNSEEERGPAWSPDGSRIVFSCRIGGGSADFEVCVMNADGTGVVAQLTDNLVPDLTATWSPDGTRIVFNRRVANQGIQLFTMNPDGTQQTQITFPPGMNLGASWGEVRVHDRLDVEAP
jgi:TolB protein